MYKLRKCIDYIGVKSSNHNPIFFYFSPIVSCIPVAITTIILNLGYQCRHVCEREREGDSQIGRERKFLPLPFGAPPPSSFLPFPPTGGGKKKEEVSLVVAWGTNLFRATIPASFAVNQEIPLHFFPSSHISLHLASFFWHNR